ncbi:MAG: glutaminyl-peptide cyclotransferase [Novosphingobium sp.]
MRRAAVLLAVLLTAPLGAQHEQRPALTVEAAAVVKVYPHDPRAFTEGLFIDRGELWESTGMVGRSSIRRVDLATGRVLQSVTVKSPHFGEGIAPWNGEVLSLTWQGGVGFRWDRKSLKQKGTFRYAGEGWSLTSNGRELVMSDGTDRLRFVDPRKFKVLRTVRITLNGSPIDQINELEWVNGAILANIWMTDTVVRIDPASGNVTGLIDLSAVHRASRAFGPDQVANGIAWDAQAGKLYVTGKEWPALFEVRLDPVR